MHAGADPIILPSNGNEHEREGTMKTRMIGTGILALVMVLASEGALQQNAEQLYQAGLYQEEVAGDLTKAIAIYEDILKQFSANREVAAKAQLHLGFCYEKSGLKQAQEAYRKVVENYPEQSEAVKAAQAKLAALLKAQAGGDKGFRIRQVWTGPDVSIGEVSPDGKYISYTDWETGDVAIRELETGKKRRLTDKGPWTKSQEFSIFSTWSPDGRRVAFDWFEPKGQTFGLRVVGLDSPEVRVLVQGPDIDYLFPGDWSPDGRYILVYIKRTGKTVDLGLVSAEDGSFRKLYDLGKSEPSVMKFSPDGRTFAYCAPSKEMFLQNDIFLGSTDGRPQATIVRNPADDNLIDWTPAGDGILFLSDRSGTGDIWLLRLLDGQPQGEPDLVKKDAGGFWPMGMTASGAVYYFVETGTADIYVATLDLEAGRVASPPVKVIQRYIGSNICPDWSRDGRSIAYLTWRGVSTSPSPGASRIICLVSTESGEERQFPPPPPVKNFYGQLLRLSPDGRSVLLGGLDYDGNRQTYILDVGSGAVKRPFETAGTLVDAEWSGDGQVIYYAEVNGKERTSKIVAFDLKTGEKRELYLTKIDPPANMPVSKIALSPDGKEIAVLDQFGIRVMPMGGGEAREVIKAAGSESFSSPAWSRDGRSLLVAKRASSAVQDQGAEVWQVPVKAGGTPRSLGLKMDRLNTIRVHPDGKRIAFVGGMGKAEVWMMENFLPAEKKKN
jgi:Tol biopolymer transport system component